jgi:hypothetical protein
MKVTDFDERELEAETTKRSSWTLNGFSFLLVHQIHHFLRVYAGQQEEPSTPVEDTRLARAVGDTQNTPATDKEDTHAVVGAG